MNKQTMHPHALRWAFLFLGLVIFTVLMLMARPAAQDDAVPNGPAVGDSVEETAE